MFWSKNKKNRYTLAYPSLTMIKVGLRRYTLHGHVFLMGGRGIETVQFINTMKPEKKK